MNVFLLILVVLAAAVIICWFVFQPVKKKTVALTPITEEQRMLLEQQVPFYQKLSTEKKQEFKHRIALFLATIRITGVNTAVEDSDRLLIAASAIIPIFSFKDWEYTNLHEVLLYPDSFNHDFEQQGADRNVLGMVGDGALNHIMVLSQHELQQAFINKTGKSNTAIHEFVHLIDKTDGSVDGIPASILQQQYIVPWLQLMHQEIKNILADKSDINPYGATNEAEFFAVVAEYFFERPDLFATKHPDLYELLVKAFGPQPTKDLK
jgi:Mlc titration factor MtfA (ptsG expression regulator)